MMIAENEPEADKEIVALAALLHDADDHKLFHTENNANTRSFLAENRVPEDMINQICTAINAVSFSRNRGKTPAGFLSGSAASASSADAMTFRSQV